MKATDVLKEEHRGIERMLNIVEAAARRLEVGEEVPARVFEGAVDFFRGFADRCHHAKEEEELFPALERHGIPRGNGPIGVMLLEHEQGRQFVRNLAGATERYAHGDRAAQPLLVQSALGYVDLLRQHIAKEDGVLFVMADQVLTPQMQQTLVAAFDEIEEKRTGKQEHERYHRLIAELEQVVAGWKG
jgi:hemerythrin-like domain-containing protein